MKKGDYMNEKTKGINVLSLCDGMSCGQIALKKLGVEVDKYYASEIDRNSIKVTMDNFPDTIQIGDVTEITEEFLKTLPKIDLVIFGSPCRSLSKITIDRKKYNKGLNGSSWLFYPCNDILQWIKSNNNPDVEFLVENVDSNKKKDIDEISMLLGVEPMLINSGLFSAQDRKRNYWTNIDSEWLPKECNLVIEDILDSDVDEKYFYNNEFTKLDDDSKVCGTLHVNTHDMLKRISNRKFKCPTLTACRGGYKQKKIFDNGRCRKLTPNEYRRLQTVPDWYKMDVADGHIYNMCGDGWTVDVISHIFGFMKCNGKNKDI